MQKLDNNDADDRFGFSVSLDGDSLAVGAYAEDSNQTTVSAAGSSDNSASACGAVYIYTRSGSTWSQEAYIKSDNADAGDYFGWSVSLDGNMLAVGAKSEGSAQFAVSETGSSNNSMPGFGAAYIYTRNGTTWSQKAYIKPDNGLSGTYFGSTVSLDSGTLAVGAEYESSDQNTITTSASSDNSASESGAVYIYR